MALTTKLLTQVSCAVMAAALIPSAPALAQAEDAQPAPGAGPETVTEAPSDPDIVVTGSRLRAEAPVGSTVTALGRVELEQSGQVTVDRAIKELPQVFDLGVSENSRGQAGGSDFQLDSHRLEDRP